MKKKVLSMILAIAMVISMFAGLATTASAAETITTGEYVIAAKVNGVYYAMSNTFASKIAGAEIAVVNGTVAAADAEAYKVTVTALGNGNITISSGANYLKYNSSTNFATATEAYEWTPTAGTFGTWRFIAASTATASTVRSLVYRTGTTNKFAPYGTSNINGTEYYDVELLTIAAGDACTHANATSTVTTAATCTTAGNSAYWSCPDCGKYFSDAAFTTETTLEAVTIPATGHTPGAYTSNNNGTHTYTCSVCNEVVTESCAASVVEEVAATCKAYSQTEYECTVCGGTWMVTGTEYGAHNWVNNVCSVCSLTRNSYVKVADVTTLKDGDGIVIYYPTGTMLLSGTASGSKLAGVAGTVTDTTVAANNADELFLIVRVDANGDYYFETNDGKYLTSGETGNSLTLADSLTDYAKWYFNTTGTTATLRIVNRNAFYNGTTAQALEYYNGFTTYSLKDNAAYNFEVYQLEGFSAHTHTWDQGTVTTEPTCTADGVKTFTCATCGDTMTEAIPALGHNYSAGDTCANCGLACIKGQLTAALADGDTVIVYNPASNMTLTNTPNGYNLDGLAAVD